MVDLLKNGPEDAPAKIILAHGAGAPMDSDFMDAIASRIAGLGVCVLRFEFDYMADRRISGRKRPPPAATALMDAYRGVVDQVSAELDGGIFVAGKSMGRPCREHDCRRSRQLPECAGASSVSATRFIRLESRTSSARSIWKASMRRP